MIAFTTDAVRRLCDELATLNRGEWWAIDTETTGFHLYTLDDIRGLSISYRDQDWYVPISHPNSTNILPADLELLAEAIAATDGSPTLHNAIFDWASLGQVGIVLPSQDYWDTQIVAWLLDENVTHALKGQATLIFGEDSKEEQAALKALMKGPTLSEVYKELREEGWPSTAARLEAKEIAPTRRKTWGTLTANDIAAYAMKDTRLTLRLREWQVSRLCEDFPTNPRADVQREHDFQRLLYRMVQAGVKVNIERTVLNRERSLARLHEIEPQFEGVNLNSPKQLGKLIYDEWGLPCMHYTKTGARSTAREALEELEGAHESLDVLLEYRKLAKRVSTYYDNLIRMADGEGYVHAGFCMTCTVTGRLSSRAPNLMNLPRESTDAEVKQVFEARPGYELWEFDLKSAELFVGADIAGDTDLLAALTEPGRDFHSETAMACFGKADEKHRTMGKNLNYGIPYGIGPTKFATYLVKGTGKRITQRVIAYARSLIQKHRMTWPVTHRAIDRLTRFADTNGYVPLKQPGRYRHFRSHRRRVPGYVAYNAVVQGGVADTVKSWMFEVEKCMNEVGGVMRLQVHDSVWCEVPVSANIEEIHASLQAGLDKVNLFTHIPLDRKKLWPGS